MLEHPATNVCGSIGHVLMTAVVVRCRHTEGWWISLDTYIDSGEDMPVHSRYRHAAEIGPFDDVDEFRAQCVAALAEGLRHATL